MTFVVFNGFHWFSLHFGCLWFLWIYCDFDGCLSVMDVGGFMDLGGLLWVSVAFRGFAVLMVCNGFLMDLDVFDESWWFYRSQWFLLPSVVVDWILLILFIVVVLWISVSLMDFDGFLMILVVLMDFRCFCWIWVVFMEFGGS